MISKEDSFNNGVDRYYYNRLLEEYPNKEVKGLHTKNPPLYRKIKSHLATQSIGLEDYCKSFGFKYGKELRIRNPKKEEKLIADLLKLYPDKVVVGLHSTEMDGIKGSNLYGKIVFYSSQVNLGIGEYINSLGFEYDRKERKENQKSRDPLDDLKDIQGLLNESTTELTKFQRSRELVTELKKIYQNGCQLCKDPLNNPIIPRIRMENGESYVEVHHISPISTAGEIDPNDESRRLLDSYLNVIVVCSHHHKVLHYEDGGYQLERKQNKPYFVSKNGKKLEIYTNKHL